MLHTLIANGIGPSPKMALELGSRLNIITGDNSLGKSFLLDLAWFALTRTYANEALTPNAGDDASLEFKIDLANRPAKTYTTKWDRARQEWKRSTGRPPTPGLVLYARVDGGFSVWDPCRNYWRDAPSLGVDDADRPDAFHLNREQVWNGLEGKGTVWCNGLLRDWVTWQYRSLAVKEKGLTHVAFKQLEKALARLSPDPSELITAAPPVRVLRDAREVPALQMPYGVVPLTLASAGLRRVVALAYLLVWAWNEHTIASRQLGKTPEKRVIFLIDEVEAHLHPRWQRVILHALLGVVEALHRDADVQLLVSTHSPLVMAGIEPTFDALQDRWFDLDLKAEHEHFSVVLSQRKFARRGTAGRWLTSEAFDLKSEGRPVLAEQAIAEADALRVRVKAPTALEIRKVDERLRAALSEVDAYWMRWSDWRDERLSAKR